MKFLVAAAGTGGHVFPAMKFCQECISENHEVIWLGTKTGIENSVVPKNNIELLTIPMSGFRGKSLLIKIKSLFGLLASILKSIYFILKYKVNFVICFGGYVSLPVGLAAWICRKPLFLHEQNTVIGTSNKILQRFARNIFLGFPLNSISEKNMILVGNPIEKFTKREPSFEGLRPLRIYVTGGSQGSEYLNLNIPEAINSLNRPIEVRHQVGLGKSKGVKELYSDQISVEIVEFYDSPQDSVIWSDFLISRAGALSLSEAVSLKRGALIIPLPSAIDNHQLLNALNISQQKMGLVHQESESVELLAQKLQMIVEKNLYKEWAITDCDIDHFQASRTMLSSILKPK